MHTKDLNLEIREAASLLDSLCIYRSLLEDPVLNAWRHLLRSMTDGADAGRFAELYAVFFSLLAAHADRLDLPAYAAERVILDENPFTLSAGSPVSENPAAAVLAAAAGRDLAALQAAVSLSPAALKDHCPALLQSDELGRRMIETLPEPEWRRDRARAAGDSPFEAMKSLLLSSGKWSERTGDLQEFHRRNGAGCFARYHAFRWQPDRAGSFIPVKNPDPVRLSDLISYETEREEVIRNTEQFLCGRPANNVLLYGDRGTGKSSTVKAILNEYHEQGLRMIEVPKSRLADFPEIVGRLSDRSHRFILFVDDLAFEDNEENYTALKAALEGGLETRPSNVLIYATSNRRHLIKEKFSERAGLQYGSSEDEVRAADSMQEKLSLSDRFGITVIFSSPDKSRYLGIIDELAARRGISMDRETLHKEALKWELWYNGRSPRTAQQFINWLDVK
jgi:predicted AAA+ superfamily ATPase